MPPIWESRQGDTLSTLMARNIGAGPMGERWTGLGKALLDQASLGGGSYSQSVLLSSTATQGNSDVQAVLRDQLHRFASQRVDLSLTTQSGARIELHLAANADGIAVDFKLAQGTLDDDDRAALSAMGDAFEQALKGLAAQPPTLDLDGLMHLDQQHLTAIDLNATLGDDLQVQLHADATQRSVSATSAAGTMKVAVDATSEAITGSAQQRQRAIASYLQQFDAATRRGHGDAALADLFKDAFAQLHGGSTTPTRPGELSAPALVADLNDRRMLSGLADFTASITGASAAPNPLRRDEVDGFDYQVSQHTNLSGARQADRSIVQQAQARLKASYHQSLQADLPLRLGTDRQSQNYTYHQIDDQADSRLEIGYRLGYMTQARLQQSASQDSRVSKYVLGQLVSQSHTPLQAQIVRDFAAQLQDGKEARAADGAYRRSRLLDGISALGLLQADPDQVRRNGTQLLND
ncbi:hypothetical protein HBH1_00654 [Herbaspirillum sp. BH-1]|uniref:Lactate dehydrogenase n=1 Tax=Herbaspirillum frisingense TaxID=92645 RepID=A0ABU1PG07_9BURK|nr:MULTISPECIES: hypothetical protein [Herbaspirillum]MDR6584859.1 hypothetical protein [Herbaspirillum frisingense]PLY60716.1 hypothetical protein HBH1_00654 [Herbaspirillum sp. BH-1]